MKYPTEFWNEMDSLVSSGKKLLPAMRDALTEQQEGMKHVSLVWSNDITHHRGRRRGVAGTGAEGRDIRRAFPPTTPRGGRAAPLRARWR